MVKLAPSRIAAFLQRPDPEIRAVLLYGPDEGLVRERAGIVARTVCPDLNDPFRVADLGAAALAADPARLTDEAAQLSLTGGRRVVRVRGAGDTLARLFTEFLKASPGDAFVVVEAGELPSRSALRRAFEAARLAVAIGCYPDTPRDLQAVIRETLSARRVTASQDAGQFLVEHLGGDRLLTRSELEKLALYAGEGGRVELEDARLSISDTAALELDDAVMAAAEGDAARLAGGASVDEVLRSARPPIFFKQEDSFRRQLGLWTEGRLRPQLDRIAKAELNMKTTGLPAETICRQAMLAVAQAAGERR